MTTGATTNNNPVAPITKISSSGPFMISMLLSRRTIAFARSVANDIGNCYAKNNGRIYEVGNGNE